MTIKDNNVTVPLLFDDAPSDPATQPDLRKMAAESSVGEEIKLEDDQFILVGFTEKELLVKKIRDEITGCQKNLLDLTGRS